MAYNPYAIDAGVDIYGPLAGFGNVIRDLKQQKAMTKEQDVKDSRQREAVAAYMDARGNPDKLMEVAVTYPEISQQAQASLGLTQDYQKEDAAGFVTQVLSDPANARQVTEKRLELLPAQGRDPAHTAEFYRQYQENPEQAIKGLETTFAVAFPEKYKAYRDSVSSRPDAYEPVLDDAGNIIAQKNTKTGKVESDPRAVDKINKFQSEIGKLVSDKSMAVQEFGEDSPQAQAIDEVIESKKKGEQPKISDISGMRKEFTAISAPFRTVSDAYKKVNSAGENAAGDLSLIFSFMKILDPGSVVREQEFANAQNAASVPEVIRNQYNRILTGERLTPEQRERFKGEAKNIFESQKESQIAQEKVFKQIAERQGFNPEDVVVDFVGDLRNTDTPTPDLKLPPGVRSIKRVE